MGGPLGSGAKVLSIYWFTMEGGQLLWAVNSPPASTPEATMRMRGFQSTTWERQAGLQRMTQCGNGETAKHPMIMCWPATKPDRKAGWAWDLAYARHGAHSSLGRLSFGRGLPLGAGANETKHWEIGQAWPQQKAHSALPCLCHPLRIRQAQLKLPSSQHT